MRTFSVVFFLALAISVSIAGPIERALDGVDEFFHALSGGDGYLAIGDLAARMAASGKTQEGANIEDNIKMFDINDDAQLDSAEFANMIRYDFDHFVNPHTIDYFHVLDANGDGVISKVEFEEDVLAIETALGLEGDQDSTDTYFDTIDSNGDGNIQVWEFFSLPNVQLNRFTCAWKCISTGLTLGQSIGGWLSNNVYSWGY